MLLLRKITGRLCPLKLCWLVVGREEDEGLCERVLVQGQWGEVRQHCRLSICENWLSWTNTETAAATPPTVMQNLLRASAQWLVLESAVFWLISPPTWVNWYLKMFLVHFTHYSGGESGNFVRNLWILSYNLSLKFGEALLLVRTEYLTNSHWPQLWCRGSTDCNEIGANENWLNILCGPMRVLPRFWCRIEAQVLKITIGNAPLSAWILIGMN